MIVSLFVDAGNRIQVNQSYTVRPCQMGMFGGREETKQETAELVIKVSFY